MQIFNIATSTSTPDHAPDSVPSYADVLTLQNAVNLNHKGSSHCKRKKFNKVKLKRLKCYKKKTKRQVKWQLQSPSTSTSEIDTPSKSVMQSKLKSTSTMALRGVADFNPYDLYRRTSLSSLPTI